MGLLLHSVAQRQKQEALHYGQIIHIKYMDVLCKFVMRKKQCA